MSPRYLGSTEPLTAPISLSQGYTTGLLQCAGTTSTIRRYHSCRKVLQFRVARGLEFTVVCFQQSTDFLALGSPCRTRLSFVLPATRLGNCKAATPNRQLMRSPPPPPPPPTLLSMGETGVRQMLQAEKPNVAQDCCSGHALHPASRPLSTPFLMESTLRTLRSSRCFVECPSA